MLLQFLLLFKKSTQYELEQIPVKGHHDWEIEKSIKTSTLFPLPLCTGHRNSKEKGAEKWHKKDTECLLTGNHIKCPLSFTTSVVLSKGIKNAWRRSEGQADSLRAHDILYKVLLK